MRGITTDLSRDDLRPYFLWDEDTSIGELRDALAKVDSDERLRLLGKMLREARDTDVWQFVTPEQVASSLPKLERHLGKRRQFWEYLIGVWRERGLLR